MFDMERARELVELAQAATPFCPACGAHTVVVADGHELRLQCESLGAPQRARLRALGDAAPHTRELIVVLRETPAAA